MKDGIIQERRQQERNKIDEEKVEIKRVTLKFNKNWEVILARLKNTSYIGGRLLK
jgi:hypothetical protein